MLLMIPFALNQPHHADGYAMPAASFKQLSRMAIEVRILTTIQKSF